MKKISILGSTGSIGTQALQVADVQQDIQVEAVSAHCNIKLLEEQIRKYRPKIAAVMDTKAAQDLALRVADTQTTVVEGMEGFMEAAALPGVDMVLTAVMGVCGLLPTVTAIEAGKDIALANKETLVAGGCVVMPLAKQYNSRILPVDSEHSAIFQCLQGHPVPIKKILLTASGGPFYGKSANEIYQAAPEEALCHPSWNMGEKITIDSASMMNKGLEIIEANWLFETEIQNIEVVVHRQSIVHSMVEFQDRCVMAQMSNPDMRLPISYALNYPERKYCAVQSLDLFSIHTLTFEKPDTEAFPCLELARQAQLQGGSMPAVLNGANEVAVSLFLDHKICFGKIPELIAEVMQRHVSMDAPSLADLLEADRWARETALERMGI